MPRKREVFEVVNGVRISYFPNGESMGRSSRDVSPSVGDDLVRVLFHEDGTPYTRADVMRQATELFHHYIMLAYKGIPVVVRYPDGDRRIVLEDCTIRGEPPPSYRSR